MELPYVSTVIAFEILTKSIPKASRERALVDPTTPHIYSGMEFNQRSSTILGRPSQGFDGGIAFRVNERQEILTTTHGVTSEKGCSRLSQDEEMAG